MDITMQIKRAYKKLKASVYYDKTQVALRNDIVKYEAMHGDDINSRFSEISDLLNGDLTKWNEYEQNILKKIQAFTFPKKLKLAGDKIIMNDCCKHIEIEENQYFINLNIEGQILGILWILLIGVYIDDDIYEHSYGNRLRNKLINEGTEKTNFSPNLFKPYFGQYESWRDKGLKYAQDCLKNNQDVIILSMDLKRFFYSVNFEKENFQEIYEVYVPKEQQNDAIKRLNDFVYNVLERYSSLFNKVEEYKNRNFLPIGFFPSNILSNWYLKSFDTAIIERWNPLYYGRYVDDIIIVDKIEKNDKIYIKAHNGELDQDEVIKHYLCNCNAIKSEVCSNNLNLLCQRHDSKKNADIYIINKNILKDSKSDIIIQNDKVKVFYFKYGHTDALLTKFKREIAKNKSEFRYMPEEEDILELEDYSEIYKLSTKDTVNKLGGVEEINIDKYSLSKFLGKYLRICGLINDKKELKFIDDIKKVFDSKTILENYTLWEKVIQILVINNKYDSVKNFVNQIIDVIGDIEPKNKYRGILSMQESLLIVLYSDLCRTFSLNWGTEVKECITSISETLIYEKNIKVTKKRKSEFTYSKVLQYRQNYCKTRMIDKNIIPALIDAIIENDNFSEFDDSNNINLSNYNEFMKYANNLTYKDITYRYYPYIIYPQDIEMSLALSNIKKGEIIINPDEIIEKECVLYYGLNFDNEKSANNFMKEFVCVKRLKLREKCDTFATKIGTDKKSKYKIAIANATLKYEDFVSNITSKPNRSYNRYKKLAKIIREAIENNADILIMPESYVPIEWLKTIIATCAKNQMAIITGVEHVVSGKIVYNLTATILPYENDECKFAHINFHTKVHYSPEEEFVITDYGYTCRKGKRYDVFSWNDLWFPVYCCFELSSIHDRALFQSYADMIVGVEWNHDTNYYSNIIESLNRDLHCYCIQVNTSDYGDSRIIKPSKTEEKNMVRTKGGINDTVLIGEIDVQALRDFQIKGYGLQKEDKKFKPTPPYFDKEIVNMKRNGILWDNVK